MTEAKWQGTGEEISVFAVGATMLRNRGRIVRWAFVGAFVALALAWTRPVLYRASASFIPQGADPARSGMASLASQVGVVLPSGGQTLTPEFYLRLIKSRELLGRIARDTLVVPEMGGKRVAVEDLLEIGSGSPKVREEAAVDVLSRRINAAASKTTSVVEFNVGTEWPSVSLTIASTVLDGVNEFNQRTRRDQAAAERKFVEGRLAVATSELRVAEDRLEQFLQGNRGYAAPQLTFTRDRLQRDVVLRQQVFTTLTQAYEDVRMREVRDTPVITIVDSPTVPSKPEARGRGIRTLFGFLLGGLAGALIVFLGDVMARRRAGGDSAADEFVGALGQVKGDMLRAVRRFRRRAAS